MSVITLLTDFGITDEYVGLMKGVILSINPSVTMVDITHQIDPQDIVQAAYAIGSSFRYFPENTVHLIVVDPGVGTDRGIIAVRMAGHFFIAPDNGVLTLIFREGKPNPIIRVDNSGFFLKCISQTFHGRDILAPVAAQITKGVALVEIGTEISLNDVVRLPDMDSQISKNNELVGKIVAVDRFGNLITNIDLKRLNAYCQINPAKNPRIWIRGKMVGELSASYASVGPHKPLAIIGSRGYLEVAVNQGSAKRYFNAEKGDTVKVCMQPAQRFPVST